MPDEPRLNDALMIRYLLGDVLSADEETQVERHRGADDRARQHLDAMELGLIARYLKNDLSERECELFETRFLALPKRRELLGVMMRLLDRERSRDSGTSASAGGGQALEGFRDRIRSALDGKDTGNASRIIEEALGLDPADLEVLGLPDAREKPSPLPDAGKTPPSGGVWTRLRNNALGFLDANRAVRVRRLASSHAMVLGLIGVLGVLAAFGIGMIVSGRIVPDAIPVMLEVKSLPSGATVYVGDAPVGTTPLSASVELPEAGTAVPVRLALAGYDDYTGEIRIEPGQTVYTLPLIPLFRAAEARHEIALDRAHATYAELAELDRIDADALARVVEFRNDVHAVTEDPDALDADRQAAQDLSDALRQLLLDRRAGLADRERGSEIELGVLDALLVLEPEDAEIVQDRNTLTAGRDRLKRDIQTAIDNDPASARTGDTLARLAQLLERFPSERPYYAEQRRLARSRVVERLRVLCSPGINFCEEYGRSALLDFPDDADIVAILDGAPRRPAAPVAARVPEALPVEATRAAAIVQALARLDASLEEARYAEPAADSCIRHASDILELTANLEPDAIIGGSAGSIRDVQGAAARATNMRSQCARLALESARSIAIPARLLEALADRQRAVEIRGDLERAGTMLQVASPYLAPDSGAGALTDAIGRWIPDIDTLLAPRRTPNVKHNHASGFLGIFGRDCEGELVIDGFRIIYDSRRNNDHDMDWPLSIMDRDLAIDSDGDFKFNLEQEASFFIDGTLDPLPAAEELKLSINELRVARARLSAEGSR